MNWVRRIYAGLAARPSGRDAPELTGGLNLSIGPKVRTDVSPDSRPAPERESSLGRDAEGHLVLTVGPGSESPSRKEGWDELNGLSPLEQYNREGR